MDVFKPGTNVKLGTDKTEAIINQVCIEGDSLLIKYECIWWNNGTRNTAWVTKQEINPNEEQLLKIGFTGTDYV